MICRQEDRGEVMQVKKGTEGLNENSPKSNDEPQGEHILS